MIACLQGRPSRAAEKGCVYMIYKPFHGLKLSTLGMGNMRLPTLGPGGPIDEPAAHRLIQAAYEGGVNYFDTAYRYHDGQSERVVGEALRPYPRDSWYLASKMPGHMMTYRGGELSFSGRLAGAPDSVAGVFEQQLEKCGVDYFDFYLLHNLCETSYDLYTDEDLGLVEYLLAQKAAGRIRYLGFSAHGRPETIERFLAWRDCFDFAQIQLNYLDWHLQQAGEKYRLLAERGIPVMVMEPCRGGRLARLSPQAEARLTAARPGASIASWAFRFLQGLPGVQVVLSGMSDPAQLADNLDTFAEPWPLSGQERLLLDAAVAELVQLVPCTACRYCCEACPQQLPIPKLIALYNEMRFDPSPGLGFTLRAMGPAEQPARCLACGACQPLCPQGIAIPEILCSLSGLMAAR